MSAAGEGCSVDPHTGHARPSPSARASRPAWASCHAVSRRRWPVSAPSSQETSAATASRWRVAAAAVAVSSASRAAASSPAPATKPSRRLTSAAALLAGDRPRDVELERRARRGQCGRRRGCGGARRLSGLASARQIGLSRVGFAGHVGEAGRATRGLEFAAERLDPGLARRECRPPGRRRQRARAAASRLHDPRRAASGRPCTRSQPRRRAASHLRRPR